MVKKKKDGFTKYKGENVFKDQDGKVWWSHNLQDLINGYKHFLTFVGVKDYYFDDINDDLIEEAE